MNPIDQSAEPGAQKSIEWLMSRCGHVTTSRFKNVMSKLKSGKPGADRQTYLWEVVIERLTGQPTQHYESAAMQHGTEYEPMARMVYEAKTGAMVLETGFHHHPTISMVGGSPDGFVGDDGGVEIKCPFNAANHLAVFLDGMPEEHIGQIQGSMWISNRQWWDFVSFHPNMPPGLDLYIQRIPRDQAYIDALESEVCVFLSEVQALVDRLKSAEKGGI